MKSSTLVIIKLSLLVLIFAQNENKVIAQNYVPSHTAYGYMEKIGIPEAKRIKAIENVEYLMPRIVGGEVANIIQYNYQAGLLVSLTNVTDLVGLCGGSLISDNRVLTAAHCWFDGMFRGSCMTVVLGSAKLYSGGLRIRTCKVYTHPGWDPAKARNDIAIINLQKHVTFSDTIAPIALPSENYKNVDFVGETVVASGFGRTDIAVTADQVLSKVEFTVISNAECLLAYPGIIEYGIICASGSNTSSPVAVCNGDSGGPLVLTTNGSVIQIGISSFGHPSGCYSNQPNGFVRVTSHLDYIKENMAS